MTTLQDLHSKLQGENKRNGTVVCFPHGKEYQLTGNDLDQLTTDTINETLAWVVDAIEKERDKYPDISGNEKPRHYFNEAKNVIASLLETKDTN